MAALNVTIGYLREAIEAIDYLSFRLDEFTVSLDPEEFITTITDKDIRKMRERVDLIEGFLGAFDDVVLAGR